VSFEIIFPSFAIGPAEWLTVLEALHMVTGRLAYRQVFDFWLKICGVGIGMGVSGIVVGFEFGRTRANCRDCPVRSRGHCCRTRRSRRSCSWDRSSACCVRPNRGHVVADPVAHQPRVVSGDRVRRSGAAEAFDDAPRCLQSRDRFRANTNISGDFRSARFDTWATIAHVQRFVVPTDAILSW
jgi:Cytochrome bd terminal oxidase subunit I